ncbi:OLC1v1028431C1 [Oldenlandia corymbosa var. corymbosa]|uniref:OLC1v1028431C1 n=1 Tax=Oldenlandia corymbosa var. corymbosa TaxID=529605 RepID=A0AAV1CDM3_OLDCO|nr:OLC1v1028431C1 [Oldenlandia corymbosa var. corymbosa]
MLSQMRRPAEYVQTKEYSREEEYVESEEVTYTNTNQGYVYKNNNATNMQMMRPYPNVVNPHHHHHHMVAPPQGQDFYGNKPQGFLNEGHYGNQAGYNNYGRPQYGVPGNGNNMYPQGNNNGFGYNRGSEVARWMGRAMDD